MELYAIKRHILSSRGDTEGGKSFGLSEVSQSSKLLLANSWIWKNIKESKLKILGWFFILSLLLFGKMSKLVGWSHRTFVPLATI